MDEICRTQKRVLLLDMHSFSREIVPRDILREEENIPDLCIGTNAEYTPEKLIEAAERIFREAGFQTARNYPYEGCYVPQAAKRGEAASVTGIHLSCSCFFSTEIARVRASTAGYGGLSNKGLDL